MTSAHSSGRSTTDPAAARMAAGLEHDERLDPLVDELAPVARAVVGSDTRASVLRGDPLGHKLHPMLTDLPLGLWMSATALDLVGGPSARPAARRLVGLGLLATGPTIAAGLADWENSGDRARRVGVVHAGLNGVAAALYGLSWLARRRGHQGLGVMAALTGGGVAGVSGYLGGHMSFGMRSDG
ncbi:DUF2231 domain-containing protein [Cellulomonas sp. SG140]|uniref:DUF2231 domain-containing protein n=1 Tax=Cellulomonas sp. SG140 TaxID=2976536 RepID=UPI0021E6EA46|nr:DUF2231 domain-containing protein [Cellulomonas sp. SG140]